MLKRDLGLFLHCLLPAALLTAVLALACAAAVRALAPGAGDPYTPVTVAVVDREDSAASRILLHAVGDGIAPLLTVARMEESAAMTALQDGSCAAVILLPEGFLDNIYTGTEAQGRIVLSSAAASHSDVAASVARYGETLLSAGQYGVFCGESLLLRDALGEEAHSAYLRQTNPLLLNEAMTADTRYFTVEETGYAGTSMTTAAYYAACWLTFALMLCALFFDRLCTADCTRGMLCRLRACGVRDASFLCGKVVYPLLFRAVFTAAALLALSRAAALRVGAIPLLSAAAALLFLSLVGVWLTLCGKNGLTVNAAVSFAGLLLCGGLIPRQMLPDSLLLLGACTPFGAAQSLLSPLFGGTLSALSVAAAVLYSAVAAWRLHARLRRIRMGGEAECT
ncbi:MAG: ABC transporter permease [Oscillospiraceae bacterium]|nr:ABC transporter permease [Oscillospiraceae bacterium]